MTDSVQVFDPGFRVLDSNGEPVNGAKIKFRLAGPGATMDVFADQGLTTNLGHTVYTRADGYPVASSGSNTTTLIYVGTANYNIEITDANDVALYPAKDNVRGALDTSDFLTSADTSTLSIGGINQTSDLTLGATHKGKLINCDPSSSTFTLTLTSAITLGDGWNCEVRHNGTANHVRLTGPQNIEGPWGARNSFSIERGESVLIRCDGATFKVTGTSPAYMMATLGRILVESRISADPGSVTARNRYIATAIFTAGGITTAVGDIIEATGQGTFIKYTPPSNCGWIAYVKGESQNYQYQSSAWVPLAATQAQMQAASTDAAYVSPRSTRFHPGVAKAWCYVTLSGTTATLQTGHNVASITRNSTGNYTVNYTTAFSSANYGAIAGYNAFTSTLVFSADVTTLATGSAVVRLFRSVSAVDTNATGFDNSFSFIAFGTSA